MDMDLIQNLLSDDVGLLTVFTIGFVICMGAFLGKYVSKKVNESAKEENK